MRLPSPVRGDPRARLLQALGRIALFVQRVEQECADEVACREGCDACCRQLLNLRGVEAAYLLEGARNLSPEAVSLVWESLTAPRHDPLCPLLQGSRCVAYAYRPAVCRTHGLPMIREEAEETVLHCCSESFRHVDLAKLSPAVLLDEGRLSLLMDAVDALYAKETGWDGERIAVDELLRAGLQN